MRTKAISTWKTSGSLINKNSSMNMRKSQAKNTLVWTRMSCKHNSNHFTLLLGSTMKSRPSRSTPRSFASGPTSWLHPHSRLVCSQKTRGRWSSMTELWWTSTNTMSSWTRRTCSGPWWKKTHIRAHFRKKNPTFTEQTTQGLSWTELNSSQRRLTYLKKMWCNLTWIRRKFPQSQKMY